MNEAQATPRWFATTHWSVVLQASDSRSQESRAALEELCRTYWPPLYAFVRRHGCSPEDAADLTQAFFARFLEKNWVAQADRSRGRFRTFLLAALKHFLADEWDKERAQKRGGRESPISLDALAAEERYRLEPVDANSPDLIYDRRWALTVLDTALTNLQTECRQAAKEHYFDALQGFLTGGRAGPSYAQAGATLGISESAVTSAIHRLRQRYRELIRAEIAQTVAAPEEIEEEIRHLLHVVSTP